VSVKTENQIWKDIIDSVNAGLVAFSVTGWTVQQSGQPSKTTLNAPTIWIDKVSDKRYGSQSRRPIYANSVLKEKKTAYHETVFQITGRKIRNPKTDTTSTQTSTDVLNLLVDYFNGQEGIDQIATVGMGSIRVTEVRTPSSISDSGLFERDPSFDITVSYAQESERTLNHVEEDITALIEGVN
jgi:hypothetical protein